MPSIHLEDLSSFGRLALKLDEGFSELARLSAQIERLNLESDSDLDHGVKLLGQFSQRGQNVARGMEEFSKSLQEARERSEAAIQMVGERAHLLHARRQQRDQLLERLLRVEEDIKKANAGLSGNRPEGKDVVSDEEKTRIRTQFENLAAKLPDFIRAAQEIKEEAAGLKFKRVERSALSMIDTLQALRLKLQTILSAD